MRTLGDKIKQARTQAGLNRETMAVALGVSLPTIQRWETNKNAPSFARVQEIAQLTEKPLSFFFVEVAA